MAALHARSPTAPRPSIEHGPEAYDGQLHATGPPGDGIDRPGAHWRSEGIGPPHAQPGSARILESGLHHS
jgi:hypothetical protein